MQSSGAVWISRIELKYKHVDKYEFVVTDGFLASFLRPRNKSYACMLTHWLLCTSADKYESGGVRVALACLWSMDCLSLPNNTAPSYQNACKQRWKAILCKSTAHLITEAQSRYKKQQYENNYHDNYY